MMSIIKANEKMLVLRFSGYKKYDYITEHQRIIEDKGEVWLLKLGKPVPLAQLKTILSNSAGLILKAPKACGGKYYYCHMLDAINTQPNETMYFPAYYKQLMEEMYWFSMNGTWIKVNGFTEIEDEDIQKIRLCSNHKLLNDVLSQTRTTMLYAYASNDIVIAEDK